MKKYSLLVLLFTAFACTNEKDVELSTIDILTGGFEREWRFVEWTVGSESLLDQDCYSDDIAIFSKGDPNSDKDSLQISTYTWKKNAIKCSGLVDNDRLFYLRLSDDEKTLYLDQETFFIEHITNTELTIVHSNTASPQRVRYIAIDQNTKITPEIGI